MSTCILYFYLAAAAIRQLNAQVLINKLFYTFNKVDCVMLIFYPFRLSNNYKCRVTLVLNIVSFNFGKYSFVKVYLAHTVHHVHSTQLTSYRKLCPVLAQKFLAPMSIFHELF